MTTALPSSTTTARRQVVARTGVPAPGRASALRVAGRPAAVPARRAPSLTPAAPVRASGVTPPSATKRMEALLFDCDGVIILSEDLHRDAYNAAFAHFNLAIGGTPLQWSEEQYDLLQNTIGGGKPKMRWWFSREGWPTNTAVPGQDREPPADEAARTALIDTLQDWKTAEFERLIASGEVSPRPGVLRLMDEAKAAGLKVGVCSAATKSACVATVTAMLGPARLDALDIFLAGDDVSSKKPDPEIYLTAAQRLGVDPAACLVIEDSTVGLKAALAAGMRCVITYHKSTAGEAFEGAERVVASLGGGPGGGPPEVTAEDLIAGRIVQDDRVTIG